MSSDFQNHIKNNSFFNLDGMYHHVTFLSFLNSKFGKDIYSYFDNFDFKPDNNILIQLENFCEQERFVLLEKNVHNNKRKSYGPHGIILNFFSETKANINKTASVSYSFSFQDDLFFFVIFSFQNQTIEIQTVYHESQNDLAQKVSEFFNKFKKEKTSKQTIYSLILDKDELIFSELGEIHHSFISENYTSKIADSFAFLQTELSKSNLQNKFVLLSGAPGSGKTHFVRALISSLPNTAIINLDQSVASNFSSSQILSALLKFKQENDFSSILFLIEDADYLILTRSLDNMGPLSSLLNASDGILGDIFNLRILATTNAKKIEIEKALLRPGRLLKHVEFDLLPAEKCNSVLTRLAAEKNLSLDGELQFSEKQSLATIYQKIYDLEIQKGE